MKHVFTLEELDESVEEYFEIKDDIREEAEKYGAVTNVTLFDKEKDGVVTVRFREFEAAEKFCAASHGRWFDHRQLEATLAEDKPRFKKSSRAEELDSEDEERLERAVQH